MVEEPFRKSANDLLIPLLAGRGFAAILTLEKAILPDKLQFINHYV